MGREFLDDFNPVRYETDKSFREGVIRRFMADLERSQLPTEEEIMKSVDRTMAYAFSRPAIGIYSSKMFPLI